MKNERERGTVMKTFCVSQSMWEPDARYLVRAQSSCTASGEDRSVDSSRK